VQPPVWTLILRVGRHHRVSTLTGDGGATCAGVEQHPGGAGVQGGGGKAAPPAHRAPHRRGRGTVPIMCVFYAASPHWLCLASAERRGFSRRRLITLCLRQENPPSPVVMSGFLGEESDAKPKVP
jgi:hypothetical protein